MWHKLRQGGGQGAMGSGPLQRGQKQCIGADMDMDGVHSMHLQKRRIGMFGVGGYVQVPLAAFEELNGARVKGVAMIEDSDPG